MSKGAKGSLGALAIALLAGVILLLIQYGIFEPASRASSQSQPQTQSTAPLNTSPSSTPDTSTPESVVAPPAITPKPVALNNTVITQAHVVVVGDKIAPTVYERQNVPGYYASVFTAASQLTYNDGCYVHWQLYNNGTLTTSADSKCGLEGGWSTTWWPNTTQLTSGTVKVTAAITTDWGATANTEADFTVQ